jgi:hypothetical protein
MNDQTANDLVGSAATKNSTLERILSIFFIYVVFEWVFWRYAPLPFQVVTLFRQLLDAWLFLCILLVCITRRESINFTGRRMLATAGIVLFSVMISTILHQTSPFYAVQSVFVVFRYMVILMLPNYKISVMFKRTIMFIFIIQVLIGLIAVVGAIDLRPILLPSAEKWNSVVDFNPTAVREGAVGISSTFLNTIDYSLYLITSYVLLFWRKNQKWKWLVACIVLLLIIKTESKTSILLFSGLLLFELHSAPLRWAVVIILITPAIALFVVNMELISFFVMNSLEYSRFGFIAYLLPTFLTDNIMNLLFGIGVDPYLGLKTIQHYPHIPKMLLDDNNLLNLKDVFWLAQLFEWGLVGFSAFIAFLISIWKNQVSQTIKAMMVIVFVLGCTNQVLEVKIFSFLLWIVVKFHKSFDENPGSNWSTMKNSQV